MKIDGSASLSQAGSLRPFNEDGIGQWDAGQVWAVSDGMGSVQQSRTASDVVLELLAKALPLADFDPTVALLATHDAFMNAVPLDQPELGASLVILRVPDQGNQLSLAWIGDCRGYVLDSGRLTLCTKDHTKIQEWVDEGLVEPEAVRAHPYRNILTQALGVMQEKPLRVGSLSCEVRSPKRVLLCSDGVSDFLDESALQHLLGEEPCQRAAQAIVEAAVEAGSGDDVSVVVLDISP
jgi:serine/threonine protein phosphatase PrpC